MFAAWGLLHALVFSIGCSRPLVFSTYYRYETLITSSRRQLYIIGVHTTICRRKFRKKPPLYTRPHRRPHQRKSYDREDISTVTSFRKQTCSQKGIKAGVWYKRSRCYSKPPKRRPETFRRIILLFGFAKGSNILSHRGHSVRLGTPPKKQSTIKESLDLGCSGTPRGSQSRIPTYNQGM